MLSDGEYNLLTYLAWTYNFDLPVSVVPAECRKTESIFSIHIPYKDIHDVMNDVFVV